jgi:hypothetical protein
VPCSYFNHELQGKESPFGSPYIMEISDTVVQGHEGFTEGSHEYLVFEKVLLSVAKKYGLHPVSELRGLPNHQAHYPFVEACALAF